MSELLEISFSKLNVFSRCKREYYYKYVERLERDYTSPALSKGTIGHKVLENWSWDVTKGIQIVVEEVSKIREEFVKRKINDDLYYDKLQEVQRDLIDSIKDYYMVYTPWKKIIQNEQELTVDTDIDGIKIRIFTKMDKVVEHFDANTRWVVDHKISAFDISKEELSLSMQFSLYDLIAKHKDFGTRGVIVDHIKPAKKVIQQNQNGSLKSLQDIDQVTLTRTMNAYNMKYTDTEVTKNYAFSELPLTERLKRHIITYTPKQVQYFYDELRKVIQEILLVDSEKNYPMTWNVFQCKTCIFRSLCYTVRLGNDTTEIMKKFRIKPDKVDILEEIEVEE